MVRVDFDQVDDAENYVSVPNGSYLCQVGEVRVRTSDDGAERWGIRWIVADGAFAGRTAAWDSLAFHPRGLRRAKLVLARLGLTVDGSRDLRPSEIEGRRAQVTVYAQERVDPVTGRRVISNRVPFAGVESAADSSPISHGAEPEGAGAAASGGDESELEGEEDLGF